MLRKASIALGLFLASCLCAPASPDQWVQVTSDHFTEVTNSSEKEARHVLDQFERMRWTFHAMFPTLNIDPGAPIVVVAAKNQKTFETVEPEAYLAKGQIKLAGLFLQDPDKNYILVRLDAEDEHHPYATIYHEYTHLQLSPAAEYLPLWLNEGLAEFYQNTTIQNKDVLVGEPSYDDLLYLQQNRLIPLDVLFKVDANSPYYHQEQKGSVFYAEAWALTHYLVVADHDKRTHRVQDYLVLMSQHQDPVVAAQKAFGDLRQLQSALEGYTHAMSYKKFVLNSTAAPIDVSQYRSSPLKPTDSDAIRADVLAHVQRTKDAQALLDQVLKVDPNNVQAHETMGFLAFRDGQIDEARKWYSEAVKLDSQSYLAHYYFAVLSMQDGDADEGKETEASLRAAIKLNPRFGPAYERLATYLGMHHENLDEAKQLALQAIKLDPGSLHTRLNAANVYTTAGQYQDAATILQSALRVAKSPEETTMVQGRIDQLAKYKAGREEAAAMNSRQVTQQSQAGQVVVINQNTGPKHPTEAADGPKHETLGVIRKVKCSYPSVIEFSVEEKKKTVALYSNNYFKLEFSALGFSPKGDIHPCDDLEGKNARVQYAESSDKTVDGQVVAIELRK